MSFIAVYHKFTPILKKHEKTHDNDCLNLPSLGLRVSQLDSTDALGVWH